MCAGPGGAPGQFQGPGTESETLANVAADFRAALLSRAEGLPVAAL